ncbi:septum formation family protein [Actinomycetospora endophytica]|uniref:Septum formation family protein n=1 Tax=Actinomycetospora endophytica TaxID=2291215 RepID=A0ABS8P4V5_9PSEU|nr:septum formation family protein [Actinomycetospora endophytica]MCD2193287.1 septum formation family protein [Actinomycetospora endophytica]
MVLRERPSSGRGRNDDSHDRAADDTDDHAARRLVARRGVVGILAGALIMLLAASAFAATGNGLGFLGLAGDSSGSSPGVLGGSSSGPASDRPELSSAPGTCLNWQRADGSDVKQVDCTQSHLFETAGPVNAAQPDGAPFPNDAAWQTVVSNQCGTLVQKYVGKPLDPTGRYKVGALKPTAAAWADGDRTVRCGLQAPGTSGALFSSTGKVADADQAVVFSPGTCLGLNGKEVSDPVSSCAKTHAAEVAGTVDLGQKFTGNLPSVDDQDNYLQPECAKVAQNAVGAQKLTDSKLTVYWTNVNQASWDAGTRRVSCNMGSLLGDNSGFAPLTGAVKDGVKIGGSAPASPDPLPPAGAPAVEPSDTAAPTTAAPAQQAPASQAPAAPGVPRVLPSLPPLLPGANQGN